MAYPFLSDAWIAEARAIRERLGAGNPPVAQPVTVNLTVTGVPFGTGTVESFIDTTSGELVLDLGQLEAPDVSLTTDYDTARAIFVTQDPAAGMQAFMAGKVVVQGDMMKLIVLQSMSIADDTAREISEAIQAMTQP
jgi:SCP-2 sterol transfer family